jgi:hypothetical protein
LGLWKEKGSYAKDYAYHHRNFSGDDKRGRDQDCGGRKLTVIPRSRWLSTEIHVNVTSAHLLNEYIALFVQKTQGEKIHVYSETKFGGK